MKFKCNVNLMKDGTGYVITPCDYKDRDLFEKLIETGKNYYMAELGTPINPRTYKQLRTVWKLVDLIWKSQNTFPPTEEEKQALYEDLKAEYAYQRPSKVNPNKLVPVGMSEADTKDGAFFIQNLIYHLAELCDIKNVYEQTEVRSIITEWQEWRASLDKDPFDDLSEVEYRALHVVSEASGKGGSLHLHHIITRGSDTADTHKAWNWVMLTDEEHTYFHRFGWNAFIKRFPNLQKKFERARNLAKKLEVEHEKTPVELVNELFGEVDMSEGLF